MAPLQEIPRYSGRHFEVSPIVNDEGCISCVSDQGHILLCASRDDLKKLSDRLIEVLAPKP